MPATPFKVWQAIQEARAPLDLEAHRARGRHYASPLTGPGQLAAAFKAAGFRETATRAPVTAASLRACSASDIEASPFSHACRRRRQGFESPGGRQLSGNFVNIGGSTRRRNEHLGEPRQTSSPIRSGVAPAGS